MYGQPTIKRPEHIRFFLAADMVFMTAEERSIIKEGRMNVVAFLKLMQLISGAFSPTLCDDVGWRL